MSVTPLIERRRRLLGSAYRLFYDTPVHIVRGEGVQQGTRRNIVAKALRCT